MTRRQKNQVNVKENLRQKTNKQPKKQKSPSKKPQASPVKPQNQSSQINLNKTDQAAQTSSTHLPTTMHSKLKEAYTNINNPLAYSGDANKLLNQIKSFKYVYSHFNYNLII